MHNFLVFGDFQDSLFWILWYKETRVTQTDVFTCARVTLFRGIYYTGLRTTSGSLLTTTLNPNAA